MALATDRIRAYDYVVDDEGWTYVVRGVDDFGGIVAKAIYPPTVKTTTKCRETIARLDMPRHQPYCSPDDSLFVLSDSQIERHFPREGVRLRDVSQCPPEIELVAAMATDCGGESFLFGSRRLQLNNAESDWDVLLKTAAHPVDLIDRIVASSNGRLRRFTEREVLERAHRYGGSGVGLPASTLVAIFPRTTLYLKSPEFEIGVFFISDDDTRLSCRADLQVTRQRSLTGTIQLGNGASYLMPRRLRLQIEDGELLSVGTVAWELAGLELLADAMVKIEGVYLVSPAEYWADTRNSTISFTDE